MEWRDCDKSEFSRVNTLSLLNYYVARVYAVQNFQSSLEFFGLNCFFKLQLQLLEQCIGVYMLIFPLVNEEFTKHKHFCWLYKFVAGGPLD